MRFDAFRDAAVPIMGTHTDFEKTPKLNNGLDKAMFLTAGYAELRRVKPLILGKARLLLEQNVERRMQNVELNPSPKPVIPDAALP